MQLNNVLVLYKRSAYKTFVLNENIRSLKIGFSDVMLEYNFLSSPQKLIQKQSKYFENALLKIDVTKIKQMFKKNDFIEIDDLIKSTKNE